MLKLRSSNIDTVKKLIIVALGRFSFSAYSILIVIAFGKSLSANDFAVFTIIESIKIFFVTAPGFAAMQSYVKSKSSREGSPGQWVSLILIFILISLSAPIILTPILMHYGNRMFDTININQLEMNYIYVYFISGLLYYLSRSLLLAESKMQQLAFTDLTLLTSFSVLGYLFVYKDTISINEAMLICGTSLSISSCIGLASLAEIMKTKAIKWNEFKGELLFQSKLTSISFANGVATNSFSIIDSLLLANMIKPAELGLYKICKVYLSIYTIIGDIVHTHLLPTLSKYSIQGLARARSETKSIRSLAMVASIAISLTLAIHGDTILIKIFGLTGDLSSLKPVIYSISIWGAIFIQSRMLATITTSIGRPDILLRTTLLTSPLCMGLLYIFANKYEMMGVAIILPATAMLPMVFNMLSLNHHSKNFGNQNVQ